MDLDRVKAEQDAAVELARVKAEQDAAVELDRVKAEQEAAEELARVKAEQEATELNNKATAGAISAASVRGLDETQLRRDARTSHLGNQGVETPFSSTDRGRDAHASGAGAGGAPAPAKTDPNKKSKKAAVFASTDLLYAGAGDCLVASERVVR